jgi:hypothetical protein
LAPDIKKDSLVPELSDQELTAGMSAEADRARARN